MFDGVRRGYLLLTFYMMEVINELGTEPSLAMLERAADKQAEVIAEEVRKTMPEGLTPLEIGEYIYMDFMEKTGAEVAIHRRDEMSITFSVLRCPFYECFLDAGIDCGQFLNGLCSNMTLPSIQATINLFDPRLKLETLVVRESAEEICLERVILKD